MSYQRFFLFALLLLVPVCAARAQPATVKGPDFSKQGGPFSVLGNLNFHHIQRIEYVGEDAAAAYGVKLDAEKFIVEAWVNVPRYELYYTYDAPDSTSPQVESKLAEIEVWVGHDADDRIHDELLNGVHGFWTVNKPGGLGKLRPVQTQEHLTYKDGKYLLFRILDRPVHHLAPFARRVVWADGKVVWFRFKRFVSGGRATPQVPHNPDAAVDDFVESHFSVRSGDVKLYVKTMRGSFRNEFFKQYAKGTFGGSV
jgi:hypothetical protein